MPLTLTDTSLDWALTHALKCGDTDIFPEIFEFQAISHKWEDIKKWIKETDILEWKIRAYRRCLVPKHHFGFRVSTQLDPLDLLIFTALIHEIGWKLEAKRISVQDNIVHSYRFCPNTDGSMFSDQYTYQSFQRASQSICEQNDSSHVVIADIADFFPRIYTHRIDNTLDTALGIGHMHAKALKNLIAHWAGSYSYGIPVGSAASRLIAEVTISDIDQILLSKDAKYVRYSDDFRIFCKSEAEAYKYLTLIARSLSDNHGLTLQQNKTKIIPIDTFRRIYLKENENREIKTLSEHFYKLLTLMGIRDEYEGINYINLSQECQKAIDELDLKKILREQINTEEPDIFLLKSLLRRLAQIGDADALPLIFDNFNKFVPVIREIVEYLLKLDTLTPEQKSEFGRKLINIYKDENSTTSQLEYSQMYILRPFTLDKEWNSNNDSLYISLYDKSKDDFSKREILLAMGRSKKDFWFRSQKPYFNQMTPWIRRAFIYSASCLPKDEYNHWIRGIVNNLDKLEFAISKWAKENPIG